MVGVDRPLIPEERHVTQFEGAHRAVRVGDCQTAVFIVRSSVRPPRGYRYIHEEASVAEDHLRRPEITGRQGTVGSGDKAMPMPDHETRSCERYTGMPSHG